ncbi:iron complex transport system permease protein [Pseudomonas duriflava]|uniref:Iron complex transport system permease protein n=1 Tax=Pseudomonas duriflava TaxID=459528 RepID=A0A562QH89_9PSED|nr:iron ABC transporter permease [Pseudomonas duriflava]TWI55560.1 iron complex transport system permease protein [Pseudomonas duriflava]
MTALPTLPTRPVVSEAPAGYAWWRFGRYSILVHRRAWSSGFLLIAAMIIVSGISLASGAAGLSPWTALAAAIGQGEPMHVFLVQELRLQRLIAGLLTGAALGVAGCLLQTLARNRLATPGIIGIDDGATAFAVASIVAIPTTLAPSALALTGAATAAGLAFGLSGGAGARGYRFIVVGIAVGALFGALTNLMLARTDMDSANQAYPWTVGSLNARPAQAVWLLGIGLLAGLPVAKYLGRALTLMRFSDSVATGLGVPLKRMRVMTLLLTVFLTALAVAVVGPVGLIALAAPEVARYLVGHQGVPVFNAALAGATLMSLADWVGRTLMAPIEIPVGVIMAVIGGPYLLWILLRPSARRAP